MSFLKLSIATVIDLAGSTVTTFLILRLIPPEIVGEYFRIVSLGLRISSIALLGIDVVIRFYLPKGIDVSPYLSLALLSLFLASLIVGLKNLYAAPLAFLSGAYLLELSHALALRDYRRYTRIILTRRSLQPLLVPLALYFYGPLKGVMALSITFLPSLEIVRHARWPPRLPSEEIIKSFLTRLTNALSLYFDKLLIGLLYGYLALGAAYFVRQIAMITSLPIAALDRYGVQEIASGKSVRREFVISTLLSLTAAASACLLSPLVSLIFPHYAPFTNLLWTVVPFVLFRGLAVYEKLKAWGSGDFGSPLVAQLTSGIATIIAVYLSKGLLELITLSRSFGFASYLIVIKITRKCKTQNPRVSP